MASPGVLFERTSLSSVFMKWKVRATGLSSLETVGSLLGTGMRQDVFHSVGVFWSVGLRLNMYVRMSHS